MADILKHGGGIHTLEENSEMFDVNSPQLIEGKTTSLENPRADIRNNLDFRSCILILPSL